ncbi:RagB/SusD family nutrient uptake outer membrane protein [Pedobacter immunditicola]|uniref:RagB/SusD family nutrient uptake outer membrane protein n=1 Tax=Pedobacter immunditicola TaxID=3133440 RepID=UPI0030A3A856
MKMKKLYILAILSIAFAACSKVEDGPLERITEDYAFDSKDPRGVNAEQFLNDVYRTLPDGFNRIDGDFLDAATDDAIPSQVGTEIERFTKGLLSTSNNPDDAWSKNYEGIRKVNLFLQKIDIVPIDVNLKATRKAEARFLRAMFYFELLKRYGGIPLVGDEVLSAVNQQNFKRNSFEESINYIVNECNALETLVMTDPLSASDYGRVSKGVVLSLKARTLLYAASPLYNGGNVGASAEQKQLQGYAAFDKERWNKAALAAKVVMDMKPLFTLLTAANYAKNDVFLLRRNTEVIFAYLTANHKDLETSNGPVGYGYPNLANGNTNPTQNLVDAFPGANGRPITETASLYNPQNPYTNRDPRLKNTVLYNGSQWLSRPLETFEGGLDKPGKTTRQTRTGYYLRKFLGNAETLTQYGNSPHNFPIFRYSDMMLSYAEAMNEYLDAPNTSVYQVLYDLRLRAGIARGTVTGYAHGLKTVMTKAEMQQAIRNERRIELAFEEHRFWDLRRWKIAHSTLNKSLEGIKITKNANGELTYARENVATIGFTDPKMYFYPIPNTEILKNTNLVQNTGW